MRTGSKARLLVLPPALERPKPACITFVIDALTNKYVTYTEHVPGSLLLPPSAFMERTIEAVLPQDVSEQCERAIWAAMQTGQPQRVNYELFNYARTAIIAVRGQRAHCHIIKRVLGLGALAVAAL